MKRVLIVDDEEIARVSLAEILRLEGYQIKAVGSGEAAVEILKNELQSAQAVHKVSTEMPIEQAISIRTQDEHIVNTAPCDQDEGLQSEYNANTCFEHNAPAPAPETITAVCRTDIAQFIATANLASIALANSASNLGVIVPPNAESVPEAKTSFSKSNSFSSNTLDGMFYLLSVYRKG